MIKKQKIASMVTIAAFFAAVLISEVLPLAALALIGAAVIVAIIGGLDHKRTSYDEVKKEYKI